MCKPKPLRFQLECDGATRLDQILTQQLRLQFPDLPLSRSWLKPLFQSDSIRVGGRKSAAAAIPSKGAHAVEIEGWDAKSLQREFTAQPAPHGSFIPIAYEDDFLLILDKPAGTPSTPHSGLETDTAVNSALAHCPALAEVGNSTLEPGLLHRLDTATRGLLAFAKRSDEYERVKALWRSGEVSKIYRAWVARAPAESFIDFPLGHDAKSAKKMIAIQTEEDWDQIRGNPSQCATEILDTQPEGKGRVRLAIQLHGGAMHQIRCHLAAVGCPVIGDTLYGGAPAPRLELQAWTLIIPLGDRATRDEDELTVISSDD